MIGDHRYNVKRFGKEKERGFLVKEQEEKGCGPRLELHPEYIVTAFSMF